MMVPFTNLHLYLIPKDSSQSFDMSPCVTLTTSAKVTNKKTKPSTSSDPS